MVCWPGSRNLTGKHLKRHPHKWLFALALAGCVIFTQYCTQSAGGSAQPLDTASYTGIHVCAACHQDIYNTFVETGMGKSFDSATKSKSIADFKSFAVFDKNKKFWYTAFWQNSKLFIKEYRLNGKDTTYSRTEQVDYIIGSGQHTNSHLILRQGQLFQAPLTWYNQQKKWDLPPGFEDHNSRFDRQLDIECISCHNALPEMPQGFSNRFTYLPRGIDCERCHGPGSAHVNYWQSKPSDKEVTAQHGKYIINPGKLSNKDLVDVCQRCHLQGDNVLKPGKRFTDFKPGKALKNYFEIYLPVYQDGSEQFDMANHAARMQKSKCYIKSQGGFNCISCHNPHVSVKATNLQRFNNVCNKCHQTQLCTISDAEMKKAQSNCVLCHMPSGGTEDIPHVTVHDHKIAKPHQTKTSSNARLTGLYAVNNSNPDIESQAAAYLTYYEKFEANILYRQKAYELLKTINTPQLWIHYYYQSQNWDKIIVYAKQYNGNEMNTCYRIGKAFEMKDNYQQALIWFNKVIENKGNRAEYFSQAIAVAFKLNDNERADEFIRMGLKDFPSDAMLWNAAGYLEIKRGNLAMAKKHILKSLQFNPDLVSAMENMAQIYLNANEPAIAEDWILKALSINPQKQTLKNALLKISELKTKPAAG